MLMNKVYDHLVKINNLDMANLVASVLEAQAALYQLADANSKGH